MRYVLALVAFLLPMVASSRADSFVAVVLNPVTFDLSVDKVETSETVGATFLWDTTTNILSKLTVSTTGPFAGFSPVPAVLFSHGGIDPEGQFTQFGIESLVWNNGVVDFELNYANHGNLIPLLGNVPGTYVTDMDFFCGGSCTGSGEVLSFGTATVTSAMPTETPEPSSLVLMAVGLVALLMVTPKCCIGRFYFSTGR
jgi:hypothetical protein